MLESETLKCFSIPRRVKVNIGERVGQGGDKMEKKTLTGEERKTKPKVEELVRLRASLLLQLAAGGPQTSCSSHSNTQRLRVKEISNKPPDRRQPDHHHVSIIKLWAH
ncbi:unnamed protein product [Leuciscus chuanchicus]